MVSKRLICELDVLAMGAGETLHLDAHTIITPSALDQAHTRGIQIVREGDAAGCGKSGAKRPCLWHRILENDGTYVIQVVQGRASVNRIDGDGPVAFGTDSVKEHNL
jgi:hypothetical protein